MRLFAYLFVSIYEQAAQADENSQLDSDPPGAQPDAAQPAAEGEGVHVAQATLSRDLRALNLVKTPKRLQATGSIGFGGRQLGSAAFDDPAIHDRGRSGREPRCCQDPSRKRFARCPFSGHDWLEGDRRHGRGR